MADLDGGDLVTRVHNELLTKHKSRVFSNLGAYAIIESYVGEYERQPAEVADYNRADVFSVGGRIWAIGLGRGYNAWWHDKKYRVDILALEFEKMPTKKELIDKIKSDNHAYRNSLLMGFGQVVLPTTSRFAEALKASLGQHFYIKWDGGFHNILLPELRGVELYAEEFIPILVDAVETVLTNPPSPAI